MRPAYLVAMSTSLSLDPAVAGDDPWPAVADAGFCHHYQAATRGGNRAHPLAPHAGSSHLSGAFSPALVLPPQCPLLLVR